MTLADRFRRKFVPVGEGFALRRSRYRDILFWPGEVDAFVAEFARVWLSPERWMLVLLFAVAFPITVWIEGGGFGSALAWLCVPGLNAASDLALAYFAPARTARARALGKWEPEPPEIVERSLWQLATGLRRPREPLPA